jgi:parallel beta-helix repeat protein
MAYAASPSFLRCEFLDNTAAVGGAVCNLSGFDMVITDCLFRGNRGAVAVEGAAKISGCDFWENIYGDPAGCLYLFGSDSIVENCTFVGNIYNLFYLVGSGGPVIRNCVIAFNQTAWAWCEGSPLFDRCISYGNTYSNGLCGSIGDVMFVDPLLCDAGSFDTSLCADSPCLPQNNPWGVLVGARGVGCGSCATPVKLSSWSLIKALYR